ncbi:hypothetical protein [Lacihabitans soyangensis]|uniref:Uncharacterized protein n=1 Tax=Lacihabitans soyangensis TaxID=869394 RepID=A0AAE3KU20_9BACT|nr:hypothetical protein [Lacihabitans soyangensis]MCP9765127.1 hypothetical protein [Lacihabitans soyangensis]
MELKDSEILEALMAYKAKKLEEEKQANTDEEESFKEKAEGFFKTKWAGLIKSKHFDLVKTVLISAVLATLSYQLPNIFFFVFGKENINASFAGMVESHSFAAFGFFVARLVVDVSLYFNEHKFYVFMKRNGNLAFDYQENLENLTKWEQTLISTIKYGIYLCVYVLLLKA